MPNLIEWKRVKTTEQDWDGYVAGKLVFRLQEEPAGEGVRLTVLDMSLVKVPHGPLKTVLPSLPKAKSYVNKIYVP